MIVEQSGREPCDDRRSAFVHASHCRRPASHHPRRCDARNSLETDRRRDGTIRKREVHALRVDGRPRSSELGVDHARRHRDYLVVRKPHGAVPACKNRLYLSIVPSDSHSHRPGECARAVGIGGPFLRQDTGDRAAADRRVGPSNRSLSRPTFGRRTAASRRGTSLCLSAAHPSGR